MLAATHKLLLRTQSFYSLRLLTLNTKDAFLITHKETTQEVKLMVEQLKQQNRSEIELHREVFRIWSGFDLIEVQSGSCSEEGIVRFENVYG